MRTHLATIYRKLGVSSKLELHKILEGASPKPVAQGDQAALISELALNLEEAISRARALGEVPRIICGSQGKIEDVIAAVLGYALELYDAEFGLLLEYNPQTGFRAAYSKGIPQPFHNWFLKQGAFHFFERGRAGVRVSRRPRDLFRNEHQAAPPSPPP